MSGQVRKAFFSEEKKQKTFIIGVAPTPATTPNKQKFFGSFFQKRTAFLSTLFVVFLVLATIFPSLLTTVDPLATNPTHAFAPPSAAHIFGTDENGRDVWARVICAVRASLLMGLAAAALTSLLGATMGLAAGLGPRWMDGLLMRLVDVMQSVPEVLLVLLIISFFGTSLSTLLVALGMAGVSRSARQVRAQVLVIRHAPFVEAATTLGLPHWRVVLRHVVPNSIGPMLVLLPVEIGFKISAVATLSFLGLGPPPPAPNWGAMLATDRDYVVNAWWLTLIAAASITLTVLAIGNFGRALLARLPGRAE
jgi:peptide/nickel transport system permease protein